MYKMGASNLQYVTSITFLLTTYSKYMASAKHTFSCGTMLITSSTLKYLAKKQVKGLALSHLLSILLRTH